MGEKTLNWGLIGAGDIARKRVAPALATLENCRLVAVSRNRAALAEEFAREFGAPKWFADWAALVADGEVAAVYIATPVFLHAEQTIRAAEAGRHILCEKPLALNAAECGRMIDAARANGVRLGVAYYRRFYPLVRRVREILASGMLGKIAFARIDAFEFFDPAPDHPRRWLLDPAQSGGGPLMDFGCHRLEVLTDLFGAVRAAKSLVANRVFGRAVEDTALVLLEFENGAAAQLSVTHAAREPRDTLEIFGTRGSIHIPVLNGNKLNLIIDGAETTEFHPPAANVHAPLIADFTAAVLAGREPIVTAETGLAISKLTEKIYRD
ncbi:MAG: Gfo/Idh/MocA family oxidoreductase [Acidobacteria bacterium]|nr:Gfo/Idh/MocA family oxidoreductase [Acidobacteriota bacterium]